MNDIMKIVQALENSNVLLKGVTKINKSGTKEQKARFLSMLLDTLRASLLGNLWTGKGAIAKRKVRGILAGYGAKRACYGLKKKIWFHLILSQTLKFKNIMKINPDLMVLFLEITFLKQLKQVLM